MLRTRGVRRVSRSATARQLLRFETLEQRRLLACDGPTMFAYCQSVLPQEDVEAGVASPQPDGSSLLTDASSPVPGQVGFAVPETTFDDLEHPFGPPVLSVTDFDEWGNPATFNANLAALEIAWLEGDFEDEVERLKALVLRRDTGLYVAPTPTEMAAFRELAENLWQGDLAMAQSFASMLDYEVFQFHDTTSGDTYFGLTEKLENDSVTRGWGSYFVNPGSYVDALIEAPHPLNDRETPELAGVAFRDSRARGFLLAGAHRHANGTGSADVAHLTDTIFHQVHMAWTGPNGERIAYQLHGFNPDSLDHQDFPAETEAVLSGGDGGVSDFTIILDQELESASFNSYVYNTLPADDPLNLQVNDGILGTRFSSLRGSTNVQGIHTRSLGGTFVHAEFATEIRVDDDLRASLAAAIRDAVLGAQSFRPAAVYATSAGLTIDLTQSIQAAELHLFNGQSPPSVTLTESAAGQIRGSLVASDDNRSLHFLPTGDPLSQGNYELRLAGGAAGIVNLDGVTLDGDRDGTPGGDFVYSFRVENTAHRWLLLPDFVRGPRQNVVLPNNDSEAGIPVRIDNAQGLLSAAFTLNYDPTMLAVTGVRLPPDHAGWQIDLLDLDTPGRVQVAVSGSTPLAAGIREIVLLEASVPDNAPAGEAEVLSLESIVLNDGAIPVRGDEAVHVVGFVGDATGDGTYSGLDASYIARVAVGLDSGFDAFNKIDPNILADVTGNGQLTALDASFVARKAVGLVQPEIPNLPTPAPSPLGPPHAPNVASFDERDMQAISLSAIDSAELEEVHSTNGPIVRRANRAPSGWADSAAAVRRFAGANADLLATDAWFFDRGDELWKREGDMCNRPEATDALFALLDAGMD